MTAEELLLSRSAGEPSVQVVPPQVQRQIDGPNAKGKRLATETKGSEKKKKKRQQIVSDGEDDEVRQKKTIFFYRNHRG
jgi:hypothetical protein